MQWKLYHIKQDLRKKRRNNERISEVDLNMLFNQHYDNNNSYGFRTTMSAPPDHLLKGFEQDIFGYIPTLKLQQYSNDIQKKIKQDLSNLRNLKKVLIESDKTGNWYSILVSDYERELKKCNNARLQND